MGNNSIAGVERSVLTEELGRFFQVASEHRLKTGKSAMMPVCIVDSVWHELVNNPPELRALIDTHLGIEMEVAHLKSAGEGRLDWVELYESHFGELPAPWFINPDGSTNDQALEHYRQTGEVRLSWDCTPGINPVKVA